MLQKSEHFLECPECAEEKAQKLFSPQDIMESLLTCHFRQGITWSVSMGHFVEGKIWCNPSTHRPYKLLT